MRPLKAKSIHGPMQKAFTRGLDRVKEDGISEMRLRGKGKPNDYVRQALRLKENKNILLAGRI